MISDALNRIRFVHETGAWRSAPHGAVSGIASFMDAVDPALLTEEEESFVVGFLAQAMERGDDRAKEGAA
jgi:hypothetical protein